MKNNLFILGFLLMYSISFAQTNKQVQTKIAPQPIKYVKPCDCSLIIKKNDLIYSIKTDSLFTGQCADFWPDGNVKVLYNYKNGKLDGGLTRYNETGSVIARESYKDGKPFGVWTQ